MTERGHVNLHVTIRRTRWGKTQARISGTADGFEVDVTVTGWRRDSVLTEAEATFAAVSANPTLFLKGRAHVAARTRTR